MDCGSLCEHCEHEERDKKFWLSEESRILLELQDEETPDEDEDEWGKGAFKMPKTKVVVVERPDKKANSRGETLEELLDAQDAVDTEQESINEWLADFQGRFSDQQVRISVSKYENGRWALAARYPLQGFDHFVVRDEFGAGKYRAMLYGPNGKYITGGFQEFEFTMPLNPKKPDAEKDKNPLADPVVSMVMNAQAENNKMLMTIVTAMISNQGSRGADLPALVDAMKSMGALSPKENPLKQVTETAQLIATLKDAFGNDEKSDSGGLFAEVKEFLELLPTIKESLPVLKGLRDKNPLPPAPADRPAALPQDPIAQKIIVHVPTFVEAARTNQPTAKWAEYLANLVEVEFLPILVKDAQEKYKPLKVTEDTVYSQLLDTAKDPAEREKIFTAIPPLSPYKLWVNKVIDECIVLFETEEPGKPAVIVPLAEAPDTNGQGSEGA